MTNFEKFGKEIIVGLIKGDIRGINKKNGELISCVDDDGIEACEKCVFNGECGNEEKTRNWLNAEVEWEDEKMTNYEKYKDEILKALFIIGNVGLSKENHKITRCDDLICEENCDLSIDEYGNCPRESIQNWLDSEYVEPKKEEVDWSKVPIDTKVLVSDDNETWCKRHFAGYRDKCIWTFNNGTTSWTVNDLAEANSWKYVKLAEDEK